MSEGQDSKSRLYGEGSRPKRMGSEVFKWQVLKRELVLRLMGVIMKRNIDPAELVRGLQIPARVSRALDALLHDPSAKDPPP